MADLTSMRPKNVRELAGYLQQLLRDTGKQQIALREAGYGALADELDLTMVMICNTLLVVKRVEAALYAARKLQDDDLPF